MQRKGHRTGYAPAVCGRCATRTTFELSPGQLAEAKQACLAASKLKLVR